MTAHTIPMTILPSPEPVSENPKGLYSKLFAVMGECGYIQKDKRNEAQSYKYVSEAAIKAAVHAAMLKHRVLFVPVSAHILNREKLSREGLLSDMDKVAQNDLGKKIPQVLTTVRLNYRFVDVDTGEFIEAYTDGVGADNMDKGVYKAITGALKYALTSQFLIATGDDPEAEQMTKAERKAAQKAVAQAQIDAQKAVADKKLAEIRKANESTEPAQEPAAPVPQLSPDEQALMSRVGTDRAKITALLGEQGRELTELLGSPGFQQVLASELKSFGALTVKDLHIPQRLELIVRLQRIIKTASAETSDELTAMLDEIVGIPETVRIFGELKSSMIGLCGEDKALDIYGRILIEHGVTHSNQFKGNLAAAKKAFTALYAEYKALTATALRNSSA